MTMSLLYFIIILFYPTRQVFIIIVIVLSLQHLIFILRSVNM